MGEEKGIAAHQLHRILEVQYKSAWSLAHRISEAMREGDFAPFGGTANGVDDHQRSVEALKGITGKRLTYAKPNRQA